MGVFDWVERKIYETSAGVKGNRAVGTTISNSAVIEFFEFTHCGASLQSVYKYQLTQDARKNYFVIFTLCRKDQYKPIYVEPEFAEKLIDILREYNVNEWHGFDMTATKVMDGSDFTLEARFKDHRTISVRGINTAPDGYDEAAAAILAHFEPLKSKAVPVD